MVSICNYGWNTATKCNIHNGCKVKSARCHVRPSCDARHRVRNFTHLHTCECVHTHTHTPLLKFTIHSAVLRQVHCLFYLTTGPLPLLERVLHTVRSSASYLNFQYPFSSLKSSSGCSHLLPLLPVTSILPSILPSIMRFRSLFL